MSADYAEKRIREALRAAGGNQLKARQQIIAWTYEDTKLLHALARPHLNGIVAYNVERVASGRADKEKPAQPQTPAQPRQAAAGSEFGMQILKALVGEDSAVFGLEVNQPRKRGQASQEHINAMRQIAGRSKPVKK